MPYIALQMYGIQISIAAIGIPTTVNIGGFNVDFPLLIAFIILAAYTYTSGLRAPAMIALVKDVMIFIVLFATIIYIPFKLGGFNNIFNAAATKAANNPATFQFLLKPQQFTAYATLTLGSALALFLYPHSLTGVLSSSSPHVVKRNAALLPIYSLMLGFLALLGYMAIQAQIKPVKPYGNNWAVPGLIQHFFPTWFWGFAFAAIAIGALVPAAVMSIAAANLFTRNIYKMIKPTVTDREESQVAKIASLVLKFGALLFIAYLPPQNVINFQLLGGVWILQTILPVFLGLYTNWFNRWALLVGWFAGMVAGTLLEFSDIITGKSGALANVFKFTFGGSSLLIFSGIAAVLLNIVLSIIFTPIFEAIGARRGTDHTKAADYLEEVAPEEPIETGREALG